MSSEKIENWLKNMAEENTVNNYLFEIESDLKKIQHSTDFSKNLRTHTALGNKIRYSIFKILEQKELCTCVLAKLFDIKEGTISHHLKILEQAGLIIGLKKGLYTVYYTKSNMIDALNA